jgi:hypothetical protein
MVLITIRGDAAVRGAPRPAKVFVITALTEEDARP